VGIVGDLVMIRVKILRKMGEMREKRIENCLIFSHRLMFENRGMMIISIQCCLSLLRYMNQNPKGNNKSIVMLSLSKYDYL